MHYSHFFMGVIVISSMTISQSMVTERKKQKTIIEIVRVPVVCNRPSETVRQFQSDQAELMASFLGKNDLLVVLRSRL
jgi:hypothetical protein